MSGDVDAGSDECFPAVYERTSVNVKWFSLQPIRLCAPPPVKASAPRFLARVLRLWVEYAAYQRRAFETWFSSFGVIRPRWLK